MKKNFGILGLLIFVCVMTAFLSEDFNFLKAGNLENLVRRTALFGIMSIGVAFVIITSGIDLSIGSVVCLIGCLVPWLLVKQEVSVPITLSIVLVGLDVLDQRLDEDQVHRLEVVTRLSGTAPGMEVTESVIAAAVIKGYLPKLPKGSRHAVFLNKASDCRLLAAERLGERLLKGGVSEIIFGEALKPNECFYRMRVSSE